MSATSAPSQRPDPATSVARITLRPLGSPLPLGAFALVPSGLLLAGLQLGWFSNAEAEAVPILLLGFAVPLQLVASVFAFLARDALVGTSFGIFTGTWLAFGLVGVTSGVTQTNPALGVFFLSVALLFAMLSGGGIVGGKVAAGSIVVIGAIRFLLSGLYELTGSAGVEHVAGIVGLMFVGVAAYAGLAALLEDSARRTILPLGRRGMARTAIEDDLQAQLDELEHEAGVREQL